MFQLMTRVPPMHVDRMNIVLHANRDHVMHIHVNIQMAGYAQRFVKLLHQHAFVMEAIAVIHHSPHVQNYIVHTSTP